MSRIGALIFVALVSIANADSWKNHGPYGGSFQSFAFHPQKENLIFASGLEGLFRSVDTGKTWNRVDLPPGEYVIRIHPHTPTSILAASSGHGIFRSNDLGETWELFSRYTFEGDFFHDLEFDPKDPNILYAISFYNGVYKSTDGGSTWSQRNSGLKWKNSAACCADIPQVEVDPNNGRIVYVLLANRIVYRSSNGGESWQPANQGLKFTKEVHALKIDPKDSITLYAGGANGIFRTVNAGKNWRSRRCGCYIWSFAINPADSREVYGVGEGALKSTDSGASWQWFTPHPFLNGILLGVAVHPLNPHIVFVGGFGGGIFRSIDSGRNWETVNEKLDSLNVVRLAADPSNSGRFFAVGGQQAFESRDGGLTWDLFLKGQVSTFWISDLAVHPKDPKLIAVAGYRKKSGGAISLSNDGGKTWQTKSPFAGVNYGCSHCVIFDPINPQIIYVAPFSKKDQKSLPQGIAKTTDQGKTWTLINKGLTDKDIWVIAVHPTKNDVLFAGTGGGKLYRSENGGDSWTGLKNLDGTSIRDIVFDVNDPNTIYISTYTSIFKSTNAGLDWVRKSEGLPEAWLNSLSFGPSGSNELYAAGEGGVFLTQDGGDHWKHFGGVSPGPFAIWTIVADPGNPQHYLAGTDRGVFSYSTNQAGTEARPPE
jgi:photosystem II stability/assembly factor-like uncharacterized protein